MLAQGTPGQTNGARGGRLQAAVPSLCGSLCFVPAGLAGAAFPAFVLLTKMHTDANAVSVNSV